MHILTNPENWFALATLTALEIILGVDNIIFISIVAGKLPRHQHGRARRIGMLAAMIMRIALLLSLAWVIGLTRPFFSLAGQEISGKDLILIFGGLFLLGKSTWEIHENLEGAKASGRGAARISFLGVIVQIMLLDIVFSLDSVITAVGMARQIPIMVVAVVLAVGVMMFAAKPIAVFVDQHPTVKMLALSFLLLIGFSLVAEGFDQHIPKGYIYFAMGFSVFVEMINLRVRAAMPVRLQRTYGD
jgi:predicted tellurium resistance membrane protein TerC